MPASEIDDIFASKGSLPPPTPSKTSSNPALPPDKEKRGKKRKAHDGDKLLKRKHERTDDAPAPSKPAKRKMPETVFDPSVVLPYAKQSKTAKAEKSGVSAVQSKKSKKAREDEDRFKDSRGTGPRRKTEEGFTIYKEDELGITDQGGGQYRVIRPVPLHHPPELLLQILHCVLSIVNAVSECIPAVPCVNRGYVIYPYAFSMPSVSFWLYRSLAYRSGNGRTRSMCSQKRIFP
ncbi:hypothetical protein GSI_06777 [Ganoderma sinense ZZ0214-1]|uniref:Uncharacterized protein n=1 Tax=Ganoderma sinense ZZ0214-1 TaxID=1077348 RepID=A0A2G8SE91_9APHY|nr:hypothetical protein GSI_06777 [Ganoderma sinense ZZ0214-1]